jgi:WD40 repeat protein
MCYSEESHYLFSSGYDGFISCHNIEEYNKTGTIKFNSENLIYSNSQGNSIYSIDCDSTGRIILASTYENTIVGFDVRQKKEIMHLRMHKDIVRGLRISPDGKIVKN